MVLQTQTIPSLGLARSPLSLCCVPSLLWSGACPQSSEQPTSPIPWGLIDGHIHGVWSVQVAAMLPSQRLSQVLVLSSQEHKRERLWPAPAPAEAQLTTAVPLLTDKIPLKRQLKEGRRSLFLAHPLRVSRHGRKVMA